jgi:hypothetical protein
MTWLFTLLTQMSPTLVEAFKDGLKKLLDELAEKAKATPNKWDDAGVDIIRKVLKVDD